MRSLRSLESYQRLREAIRQHLPAVADDIRREAARIGLTLRVSEVTSGETTTFHWQFDDAWNGRRVLDYWPMAGTWWCKRQDQRGTVADPLEALKVAMGFVQQG